MEKKSIYLPSQNANSWLPCRKYIGDLMMVQRVVKSKVDKTVSWVDYPYQSLILPLCLCLYLIWPCSIISFSNSELGCHLWIDATFYNLCELSALYLFCVPVCVILPSAWPQHLYTMFSDVSVCLLVWLYSVSTGFWPMLVWFQGLVISNWVEL